MIKTAAGKGQKSIFFGGHQCFIPGDRGPAPPNAKPAEPPAAAACAAPEPDLVDLEIISNEDVEA